MLNFLRPTLWKILLAAGVFAAASFLWQSFVISRISDTFPLGFPFEFFQAWGPCPPGQVCSEFSGIYLLLDVLIWYAVSAWIVDHIRRT